MSLKKKTLIAFVLGIALGLARAPYPWVGEGAFSDSVYVIGSGLSFVVVYMLYKGIVILGRKLLGPSAEIQTETLPELGWRRWWGSGAVSWVRDYWVVTY